MSEDIQKKVKIITRDEGIVRTTTKGLLGTAEQFLKGYKLISKEYVDHNKWSPNLGLWKVRYYLLGHSLELVLKSFLMKQGVTLNYLKNKLGHNLAKCLSFANQKGLNALVKEEEATIRALDTYYSNKEFEYQQIGFKSLPVLSDVEKIVEKLIVETKK